MNRKVVEAKLAVNIDYLRWLTAVCTFIDIACSQPGKIDTCEAKCNCILRWFTAVPTRCGT